MNSKYFIIFIMFMHLNLVCLHPRVDYNPTEFPYSRCFDNGTNKVVCEEININKEREEKESLWPPGQYAIPMSKYGCPESSSRGWSKSFLKVNMTVLKSSVLINSTDNNSTESEQSSSFIGDDYFKSPYQTDSLKFYLCVKFRNKTTLDRGKWIPGNYFIYKIGSSCPTEFEESNRTFEVHDFMKYGNVPDIAVSEEEKSINISICKRTGATVTMDTHTNETYEMLKTDFILEKDPDTNCSNFNVSTMYKGETHCFYNPKVFNFDYETAIELLLNQIYLSKFHQETDFEWYFLDCKRSFEVVMIDIRSSSLQKTYFKCFVNDAPWNLEESLMCNIENGTVPGTIYLRRTHGRFFTFAFKENIADSMSFKVYISSIEAQNGELCFESIDIDDKTIPSKQVTTSSAQTKQLPTASKNLFTGWIHNGTDLTPWLLVDLIDATTIEGVGVYFSKECEMWSSFELHFGMIKDQLQIYNQTDFRIFPPENYWNMDQVFLLPTPIKARYIKLSGSLQRQANSSRCLIFKIYGCKMTRITDLDSVSDSVSEMWPLDQELRSAYSKLIWYNSAEKCKTVCQSQSNCSVASVYDDNRCVHYMGSQLGIWKSSKIDGNVQWFVKLRNSKYMTPFPRAESKNGSFFGIVKYVNNDSIITSVSYPFTTILDNDIQWIINFEATRFVKLVFTNISLSECVLLVTSKRGKREFIIDERLNDEVFVIETDKNLIYLTTLPNTIWSATIKFRAIVTAEEIPACFKLDFEHGRKISLIVKGPETTGREENCREPKMILTSLATLNLYQGYDEKFKIEVGEHHSINIMFIDFYVLCYQDYSNIKSRFAIVDDGTRQKFCTWLLPPKIYQSKRSIIEIEFFKRQKANILMPFITGQREGFRLQYEISDHSLQSYTDGQGPKSSVCSTLFMKCYKVFLEKRQSWESADAKCKERNEQLVTITSRKEMKYIQYLLRKRLYQNTNRTSGDDSPPSAHIGLKRVQDRQRKTTTFAWINSNNVTYSAWRLNQPSTGDCTKTLFENFNTENLWETEDCFNSKVDFSVCEAPYSKKNSAFLQVVCKSVEPDKNMKRLPLSGRTCQNWKNMSDKAKVDFYDKYSGSKKEIKNSTNCSDHITQDIPWCYVNDPGRYLREPCFLQYKNDTAIAERNSSDVYTCDDGSSIPMVNLCDKTFDCLDFSDELSCLNDTKECDDTEFLCDGGNCIKISQVCDLKLDCVDGTDENCAIAERSSSDVYTCNDGSSIPMVNLCDKTFDCLDFSDELSCVNDTKDQHLINFDDSATESVLPSRLRIGSYYRCERSKEWISFLAKCDGTIDCNDASDEVDCLYHNNECDDTEFLCDGGNCIKISQVCDLKLDCVDGTDENCDYHKCKENEFRCENTQCIPLDNRCNAIPDCTDNSDEINCDHCTHSFRCVDDSKCIPNRLTCDKYLDCKDGRDEKECDKGEPPISTDLGGEYLWTGYYQPEDYDTKYSLDWDFTSTKNNTGRITFTSRTFMAFSWREKFIRNYSCFMTIQSDCRSQFREAALVDNYNNNFAYPFCECKINTIKFKDTIHSKYEGEMCNLWDVSDTVWTRQCDEGEIIESGDDVNTEIYQSDGVDIYRTGLPTEVQYGPNYCIYEYNTSSFGEFFNCKRDHKSIPMSMVCIYSLDASGYMKGCRSGDHLQNCGNFSCPENTFKCPGSYCIEQRFMCDGHIECPGGEDEQKCFCTDSDREIILFVDDEDSTGKETARKLAEQFFSSAEKSIVKLLYYKSLHRSLNFDIEYRLLDIREERVLDTHERETKCNYKTLARDFMKRLKFEKPEKSGIVLIQNSYESSIVANLTLSNLSEPGYYVYRVIKDFSSSIYKKNVYKFVKDIHINKWSSLFSTGYRRFPEICTEALHISCAGKFRCSSSKQCIPLAQVCDNVTHCTNGDDERLCDSKCPRKCNCSGDFINCRDANISFTDILSLTIQARSADISRNPDIKRLKRDHLMFPYMLRLNISSCEVDHIDKKAFFGLKNLVSLDLGYNKISLLPERVFSTLHSLTYLNLDGNLELVEISPTAFQGLTAVRSLRISGTNLKKISKFTFSGLKLDFIDISNNKIEVIEDKAFNNTKVHKINFEGNKVLIFGEHMFNDVTSLQELRTPAFKFCCIRPCYVAEEDCKPLKNEFSSCEDLMRNSVLQAVLWIVGLSSLCGNFASIVYRLVFDRERLKIGYGIFVTNLAAADFLMGVYLIIIAVTDSLYRNRYIFEDEKWRDSNWCNAAGVLSTISSEASVFFLCMITLDRLLVIKFPFGTVRFGPMKAYLCSGICWLISIILSVIPVLYKSHFQNKFYSKTGVCIALPLTRDKPPGWIYSVSIFVGLNFCTFILVAVGQISIFTELRRSSSSMKKTQKSRKRDLKVARNLILVATTDFLCWFPIGVMGILALNGFAIPGDVYAWSAVFILPINSALNPFLYTVSAIIGKKSFNPSLDEQSRSVVQKEIGTAILEYEELRKSVRIKREPLNTGTMRSIQEILNDDRRLSINFVAAVSKKLADYLRLLHESSIQIDKITEANIYIKTKGNKPIVIIDAKPSIAVDERTQQENIRQFGMLLRKLISKCERDM